MTIQARQPQLTDLFAQVCKCRLLSPVISAKARFNDGGIPSIEARRANWLSRTSVETKHRTNSVGVNGPSEVQGSFIV